MDLAIDKETKKKIAQYSKEGYPNPIHRANFEKIPLDKLLKIHYIACRVIHKRKHNKDPSIGCNPVKIKNIFDARAYANQLLADAEGAENYNTGLMGEGVLIAAYCKMPILELEIQERELSKEIKRKKDYLRVKNDTGRIDNIISNGLHLANQGEP